METKIKWNEGEGHITATYEGSGSGSAILTSDVNEGLDREQPVSVSTTKGENPINISVSVKQYGMREVFNTEEGFVLADGGTLNVLKNEL